jgi:large subunit ribosomal protein L6
MSRIGKLPVPVPAGVTVTIAGRKVEIKGKQGTLSINHRPEVQVVSDGKHGTVTRKGDEKQSRAYHGLTRALINNMIQGVSTGFRRELEVNGVGWVAKLQGKRIALTVGYADTRYVNIPEGVKVEVQQNRIIVTGPDKQQVGQFAAQVRAHRKPEPYNGKGIKYSDEVIVRKEGKAFAGGG